jgi:hypothetical protein
MSAEVNWRDKEASMTLERGRAMVQGTMILLYAAIALWISTPVGLALVALTGVLKLQETVTDWCPSDLVLKPLGFKRRIHASAGTS